MASNHKLSTLLQGRTLQSTSNAGNVLTVTFTDGAHMTVQTQGSANSASTGGTVRAVRQSGTDFSLDFENGQTLSVVLAEATSSVMVRDKAGTMEYAD